MTTSAPSQVNPPKDDRRSSDRFVDYVVQKLRESTQTRAELRRGLGLPVERCNYLHRHLVPWLKEGTHPDAKRAHYAVAALIAARPRTAREPQQEDAPTAWYTRANLGDALGEAVRRDVMKPGSAESALHLMSRQTAEAVHTGLPALTRQLLSGGIRIDWAVLLEDLTWWNRQRDRVATRWLEHYFRVINREHDPDTGNNAGTADDYPVTPKPSKTNTPEETER